MGAKSVDWLDWSGGTGPPVFEDFIRLSFSSIYYVSSINSDVTLLRFPGLSKIVFE